MTQNLYQSLIQTYKKNKNLVQLLNTKIHNQTEEVLNNYNKSQKTLREQDDLRQEYEKLMRWSEDMIRENERLDQQGSNLHDEILRMQSEKTALERSIQMKKLNSNQSSRQAQYSPYQIRNSPSPQYTSQLQKQGKALQQQLSALQDNISTLTQKNKEALSSFTLLKNQTLLIKAKKEKLQTQTITLSLKHQQKVSQIQRQLQEMKREIMQMRTIVEKEEEYKAKKTKAQALGQIRNMIRKHRQGNSSNQTK